MSGTEEKSSSRVDVVIYYQTTYTSWSWQLGSHMKHNAFSGCGKLIDHSAHKGCVFCYGAYQNLMFPLSVNENNNNNSILKNGFLMSMFKTPSGKMANNTVGHS